MKKILSFLLIFVLLFTSSISLRAQGTPSEKKEIVYGILNLDGSVNNLYVVNIFNGGSITDYGNYTDILNMTTSEKINQKGDQITINTQADRLYYQGNLQTKELPWDIDINYFLDGKEIEATQLAGKSGRFQMAMSVKQNNNINSTFFDNYALQIALSLDNKLFSNIKADNATIAEAGRKKQLAYTLLPGNTIDIVVEADVQNFDMEPITINGIKLSLGITVDRDEFAGQILELTDAIKGLDEGATELLSGLNQLSIGFQRYTEGMKAFKDGLGQFVGGADMLNMGAVALRDGLSQLSSQNNALMSGALAIQQATFDSVNAQLKQMGLELPVLTLENYSQVLSASPSFAELKNQLDGVVQFTQGLRGYTEGVTQLGIGASDLARGTLEFKSSSAVLASSANELYNAAVELNIGMKRLQDGLALYRQGTKQLRDGTSTMDSEIASKIDEMLSSISGTGDQVVSFVSNKNTNVSAVQFVLKTGSISVPEAPKAIVQKPVQLSFWQRILKLFGLYK